MNYKESIQLIINQYGIEVFNNPFYAYCLMSEHLSNDKESQRLSNILFEINKQHNVITIFKDNGLSKGREILKSFYQDYSNLFSIDSYINSINPIAEILFPNEYISNHQNNSQKAKCIIVKSQNIKPIKNIICEDKLNITQPTNQVSMSDANLEIAGKIYKLEIRYNKDLTYKVKSRRLCDNANKRYKMTVFKNKTRITFNGKNSNLILFIPRRIYDNINIIANCTYLKIVGEENHLIASRNIAISSKARLSISVNSETTNIKKACSVMASGKFNTLKVHSRYKTYIRLLNNGVKRSLNFQIKSDWGNVYFHKCSFLDLSEVSSPFKKKKKYEKKKIINGHSVRCYLYAPQGQIKICKLNLQKKYAFV